MTVLSKALIRASLAMAAASALVLVAGCSSGAGNDDEKTEVTLWYWPGALDETVLAQVPEQFPDVDFKTLKSADVLTKFRTAVASGNAPDISVVGGTLADYEDAGNVLADLGPLGADKVKDDYVTWKWDAATFQDGTVAGFPIDAGPFGFFYRTDLVEQFGLPSDPTELAAELATLDDYAAAARDVAAQSGGKVLLCTQPSRIFYLGLAQADTRFVDRDGNYIGDSPAAREAWDRSSALAADGSCPVPANNTDFNSMLARGEIAGFVSNVWDASTIKAAVPDQSGLWRVATPPGGAASETGSWLVIPETSKNKQVAYDIVQFLLSPENQAKSYVNTALMPSAIAAFTDEAANAPDEFFGGQRTLELFGGIANDSKIQYRAANDEVMKRNFGDGLAAVESQNADSDAEWDKIQQANRKAAGE